MQSVALRVFLSLTMRVALAQLTVPHAAAAEPGLWAEIKVIDGATGRGVPLVGLETVNGLRFVTDSAGRVAFYEPGLMGREIFFGVRSHGYDVAKDGFGIAGVRLKPQPGEVAEVKLTRRNVAERLCRLTGEGLYRDSVLLGHEPPSEGRLERGGVAGQDSVQAAVYRGRAYWLWGDTQRMSYPLGLFRTAGATTPLFAPASFDPAAAGGIPYEYFIDEQTGFARAMMPLPERPEGVIWIFGLFTVADAAGAERLVAHYSRRKGLFDELEQGIAVFNDEKAIFESAKELPLSEKWRFPTGHPIRHEEDGIPWLLFGSPTPNVRVRATFEDVLDPARYEAFTCAREGATHAPPSPTLNDDGSPAWRWQRDLSPVSSKQEREWIDAGKIRPQHARFSPVDATDESERIVLHSGTVRWNPHRKRWVMLAGQIGGKASHLGEVWYAEASHPTGPFAKAVRVVTHDRQSFYNVCHHDFLDRDGGRTIHFEGTYTNDFSGNPDKTPRYNYNQVLYRLDVDAEALRAAREE